MKITIKTIIALVLCASRMQGNDERFMELVRKMNPSLRQHTMELAVGLMHERQVKTIVETGTSRSGYKSFGGDGGFTILIGFWCKMNNAQFYSVDISADAVRQAQEALDDCNVQVNLVQDDSVHFLKNFDKTIDFLYLDSFDFDSKNPEPSQLHHLYEIDAAYEKLSEHAVVMIDDCGLEHGGKGPYVIAYLLAKGWRVYANDYQVIMVRS